jgi:NAD(P)H-dependent FMN reductase
VQVVAFNGSPRQQGNSALLLREVLRGARDAGATAEEIVTGDLNLHFCRGCLRCNLLKRCALRGDDWQALSARIVQADALVFASPVYFHHVSASMKKLIDRFRSFVHVRITAEGLIHIPWHSWHKTFVLIMSLGSPDDADAEPAVELFRFMSSILGTGNRLETVIGTRLAAANQVAMPVEQLQSLYQKLGLPTELAEQDCERNRTLLKKCYEIGRAIAGQ